jgi:hypothetical protein
MAGTGELVYLTLQDISEFWSVVPRPVIDNSLGFSGETACAIVQTLSFSQWVRSTGTAR